MSNIDIVVSLSFIFLNIDILLQNVKVYKRRSSQDIALPGTLIRYLAILIILYKYLTIKDSALIAGQLFILLNVSVYILLILKYRKKKA